MTAPPADAVLGRTVDADRLRRIARTVLPPQLRANACDAIRGWPDYAPTPLVALPGMARQFDVASIQVKDEGGRFGLGSFKALGGAYAVAELARGRSALPVFATATDGNHGRSVAWGARLAGAACVVFLHEQVSEELEAAILAQKARVMRVSGSYDDSVRACAEAAMREGWTVVSDTAWTGYEAIPRIVMCGYALIADEVAVATAGAPPPTHVFLQAGVGGMAAALIAEMAARFAPLPRFVTVEPAIAACLLASVRAGHPVAVPGPHHTIAGGLACGEPSPLAWPIVEAGASACLAVAEESIAAAVRLLARPIGEDPAVVAGPSGAAGLAGLLAALADAETRTRLGLDGASRVLVVNTESDTDPALYRHILAGA